MLCFENNAQAGYFVKQFMDYVRAQREAFWPFRDVSITVEDGNGLARQLFVSKAKKGQEPLGL